MEIVIGIKIERDRATEKKNDTKLGRD